MGNSPSTCDSSCEERIANNIIDQLQDKINEERISNNIIEKLQDQLTEYKSCPTKEEIAEATIQEIENIQTICASKQDIRDIVASEIQTPICPSYQDIDGIVTNKINCPSYDDIEHIVTNSTNCPTKQEIAEATKEKIAMPSCPTKQEIGQEIFNGQYFRIDPDNPRFTSFKEMFETVNDYTIISVDGPWYERSA